MKKLACFIPLVASLFLLAAPAFAETTKYRFELTGAATFPREKGFEISHPQSTVPMQGTLEFSQGAAGGVRFGADSRHWGQDFIYSYGSNAARIVNRTNGGSFAFTDRVHQFSYNAMWYPGGLGPRRVVNPYVTAGVGGVFHTLSSSALNEALDPARAGLGKLRSENVFAFNAGGGVKLRINSVYGLRIDVRDTMSRAVRYGLPRSSPDPQATVFPVGGVTHRIEVSVSFVYYFQE